MRKQIFGILVILIITLLMGLGIYLTQEYRFYNMESNNMFLYDGADILYKLQQTGGLALLMASFISQFNALATCPLALSIAILVSLDIP